MIEPSNGYELVVAAVEARRAIFLCGAGVSYSSGLPLVGQFIDELGELLGLDSSAIQAMKSVQFEYLFSRILEAVPVRDLLTMFDVRRPSFAHKAIAALQKQYGPSVLLTTNFDCNFEAAYQGLNLSFRLHHDHKSFDQIDARDQKQSRIIKLHGSAHETASMAIFAQSVANGLNATKISKLLAELIERPKEVILVALGYSFSDRFDVVPAIQTLMENGLRVLNWQHAPEAAASDIDNGNFQGFAAGEILYSEPHGDTDAMLRHLLSAIDLQLTDDNYGETFSDWRDHLQGWWATKDACDRWRIRASVYAAIGDHEKSMEYFERALNEAHSFGASHGNAAAELACSLGGFHTDMGNLESAKIFFDEVITAGYSAPRQARIMAFLGKARIYGLSNNFDAGMKNLIDAYEALHGPILFALIPQTQKQEVLPTDPDAYLWASYMFTASGLFELNGQFDDAASAVCAAADIASLGGLFPAAYLYEIARLKALSKLAIQRGDELAFWHAHERFSQVRVSFNGVFEPASIAMKTSNILADMLEIMARTARCLGWDGFLAFMNERNEDGVIAP